MRLKQIPAAFQLIVFLVLIQIIVVNSTGTTKSPCKKPHQANAQQCLVQDEVGDVPAWSLDYLNEMTPGYEPILEDTSTMEKYASLLFTQAAIRPFNVDYYTYNSGNDRLDLLNMNQSAGSRVDNDLCAVHLRGMLKELHKLKANESPDPNQFRLAHIMDSFGRYESGGLSGRMQFLGSARQCAGKHLFVETKGNSTSSRISMRYCIANFNLRRHLTPLLKLTPKSLHDQDPKVYFGICIPEACHSISYILHSDLFHQLIDQSPSIELPRPAFGQDKLELDSIYCKKDSDSKLAVMPLSGQLLVALLLAWTSLATYVTLWRNSRQQQRHFCARGMKWLNNLDLKASWSDFVTTTVRPPNSAIDLDTINPIKVICCFLIVLGHQIMVTGVNCADYAHSVVHFDQMMWAYFTAGLPNLVDIFQVITGLLTGYFTVKLFSKTKRPGFVSFATQCLQFITSRYLRLMPLYFLVFWAKKSIIVPWVDMGYTGDEGFNRATFHGSCRTETWFSPLLLISSFISLSKQCIIQSWTISGDLLSIVVFAPIIVLMSRRPRLASFLIILASIYAVYNSFKAFEAYGSSFRADSETFRTRILGRSSAKYSLIYTNPIQRIIPLGAGITTGYWLYLYNQPNGDKLWPSWMINMATVVACQFMISIYGALYLIPFMPDALAQVLPVHKYLYYFSMTIGRPPISISAAILLFRVITDWKDSKLMRFCANKFWKVFCKLNYAILLVHFDLLNYITTTSNQTWEYYTVNGATTCFITGYIVCIPISIALHVVIENPIDKCLGGYSSTSKSIEKLSMELQSTAARRALQADKEADQIRDKLRTDDNNNSCKL